MSLLDAVLPSDRKWVRLGDVYEITRKPRNLILPALVPFAPMDMVPQGGAYDLNYEMRPAETLTSGTYFESGNVLVAKITPSFENGKRALAINFPHPFGYATTEVIPLRPLGTRDPRFLFYYLLHPDVCAFVAEKMEGATGRQRVPDQVLLDLPFPDVPEEASIASILELVQRAIAVERGALDNVAKLKTSAMKHLFTRGLRGEAQKESELGPIPESWTTATIGENFSLQSGGTPSRSNPAYWNGGTIPWVKTGEVDYGTIRKTEEHITWLGLEESAAKVLPAGTLLIAMYGQGITRGKVAILGIDAACNQACAALTPKNGRVKTKFLFFQLSHSYERLRTLSHGGQQQNLNMDIVREFSIAFPGDAAEQEEIVNVLDAIDKKMELHSMKAAAMTSLFESLLHKLMTGEILPSGLNVTALNPQSEL
jgi:type I restriction enzyme S subunit